MRIIILSTLLLTVFCLNIHETFAQCNCVPKLTVHKHFQRSDAVFVGKVIEAKKIHKDNDENSYVVIKFEVKKTWKQDLEKFVNVKEFYGSTEGFEPNTEWLLYAFKDKDGTLQVTRGCCSRTKPLLTAQKQGDVKTLKRIEKSPKTILEVSEIGGGMVAVSGEYLFLRIIDNGKVEYEEVKIKNGKRILVYHKYFLPYTKFEELKYFLESAELKKAKKTYKPDVPILDHIIKFNISIILNSKNKTIKLVNYNPSLNESDEKYPAKLIELVCRIKALRAKADFHILGNDCVNIKKIKSKSKKQK